MSWAGLSCCEAVPSTEYVALCCEFACGLGSAMHLQKRGDSLFQPVFFCTAPSLFTSASTGVAVCFGHALPLSNPPSPAQVPTPAPLS